MNERTRPEKPAPMPNIEKEPEPADSEGKPGIAPSPLSIKRRSYNSDSPGGETLLTARRSSEAEPAQIEKPVRIISYYGSLSDKVGNEGDFYVDEMTNILYGPKANGVWPERGVSAAGLCKRTFIALAGKGAQTAPADKGLLWCFKVVFRFLLPVGFSKGARA